MTTYCWHVHHRILCEALTEPIENRIAYIEKNKPLKEIETRLRLLKPVLDVSALPARWKEAYAKREEAYAKWEEAYAKWKEADAKWKEADAKWEEAYAKWEEADAKWEEAYAKREEAYAKWEEAYAKCLPQLEELHKRECPDCPWDGTTIFP